MLEKHLADLPTYRHVNLNRLNARRDTTLILDMTWQDQTESQAGVELLKSSNQFAQILTATRVGLIPELGVESNMHGG